MTDAQPSRAGPPPWVRQLVDFGALLAFGLTFVFFRLRGLPGDEALVHATWGLVAGSIVAVVVGLLVEKRIALMPLLVGGFALVFGVLTLLTKDDFWAVCDWASSRLRPFWAPSCPSTTRPGAH
jgi:intracellular septation protein